MKNQTILMAVVYAVDNNLDIIVKKIERNNYQPYVLEKDMSMSDILREGYYLQEINSKKQDVVKDEYIGKGILGKRSEDDWRALNIYYFKKIQNQLCKAKLLNSSPSPIAKIKSEDLSRMTIKKYGVKPDTLLALYKNYITKKLTSMNNNLSLNIVIKIEEYKNILGKIDTVIKKNEQREIKEMNMASMNLYKIMFDPERLKLYQTGKEKREKREEEEHEKRIRDEFFQNEKILEKRRKIERELQKAKEENRKLDENDENYNPFLEILQF